MAMTAVCLEEDGLQSTASLYSLECGASFQTLTLSHPLKMTFGEFAL